MSNTTWHLKLRAILPTMRLGLKLDLFLLRITTLAAFGILAYKSLLDKIPFWLVIMISAITAVMGSFVIDGLLDRLAPFAFSRYDREVIGQREKAFHWFIRVFVVLLLIASGTITWWLMPEISAVAVKPPDDSRYLSLIDSIQSRSVSVLEERQTEIATAQATERQRVRDAERQGKKLVETAINAGGDRFAELWRQGNTWVRSDRKFRKVRAGIEAAQRQADELVAREKNLVASLRAERADLQRTSVASADSVATTLATTMTRNQQRYFSRLDNLTRVLVYTDAAWMAIAFLLLFFIGMVDGHEVTDKKSALGILFEVIDSREQQALSALEWRLVAQQTGQRQPKRQVSDRPATEATSPPDLAPASATGAETDSATIRLLAAEIAAMRYESDRLRDSIERAATAPAEKPATTTDLVPFAPAVSLSDKGSSPVASEAETAETGPKVVVDKQIAYRDLKNLIDRTKKNFERQFETDDPVVRERRRVAAEDGITELLNAGCNVVRDGKKLSVEAPK